jgi:tRNA 2-thiouridine synthesizing protein A
LLNDYYCDRLKGECEPGVKGCVLYKKVKFIEPNEPGNKDQMAEQGINSSLNLKGVKCPLNFVKLKLRLEEMKDGQNLEVILDDGEPIQNVPRAVKEEGHKIIKVERGPDGSFRLMIKKGGMNDGR